MADTPLWTIADRDAVKAAVIDLATGKRKAKVVYAGPPSREVDYTPADLPQLRLLLAEIDAAVRGTAGAPRFRRAGFSKGFDRKRSGSRDG